MSALGTEFTLNIHLEPIDGYHMEDYDFECEFFVLESKSVVIKKKDMQKVDKDNYKAVLEKENALKIGKGQIKAMVTAYIPDTNYSDDVRQEKKIFVCEGAKTM